MSFVKRFRSIFTSTKRCIEWNELYLKKHNGMINFPALHYPDTIADIFSRVRFIDIPSEIQKGLQKEINFVDLNGGLTDLASIDETGQVEISATFCQMMWFISYVAIYLHDYLELSSELSSYSDSKQKQFIRELEYCPELKSHVIDVFKIEKPTDRLVPLTDIILKLASGSDLTDDDIAYIEQFNSTSSLSIKAGSAYCYAVVFDLLHEASHYSLEHDFTSDGSLQEEEDADDNAFLTMISDLIGNEEFSSKIGIITALASLLFINPELRRDHIHPYSDKRLFGYFDQIEGLGHKGTHYLVIILTLWSICLNHTDFPKPSEDEPKEETLSKMRCYLDRLCKRTNGLM